MHNGGLFELRDEEFDNGTNVILSFLATPTLTLLLCNDVNDENIDPFFFFNLE